MKPLEPLILNLTGEERQMLLDAMKDYRYQFETDFSECDNHNSLPSSLERLNKERERIKRLITCLEGEVEKLLCPVCASCLRESGNDAWCCFLCDGVFNSQELKKKGEKDE